MANDEENKRCIRGCDGQSSFTQTLKDRNKERKLGKIHLFENAGFGQFIWKIWNF